MTENILTSEEKKKAYNRQFMADKRAKLKEAGQPQGNYNKEANTEAMKRFRDKKKPLGYETKSFSFVPPETLELFEKIKNDTKLTDTALLSLLVKFYSDNID